MDESRNSYRVLVGTPEGERPLGRPRRRWEDNIKMDLREVGYDDREWINLGIGTNGLCEGGNEPLDSLKAKAQTGYFSRKETFDVGGGGDGDGGGGDVGGNGHDIEE
ncbi:hypothetical protein ANN_22747 [Periplaneta americana]|uniref:Uncharacterized protein n=1 Tax=Periplaneta americana TaxID=6978 RepID=A0ABQ8SJ68_PERAM|nr:hypothetical protein ANN_22747 [Periplaneta americana]